MKKVISFVLSLLMMVSCLFGLDFSASAATMPEYNMETYIADYLSDLYRGPNYTFGKKTIENSLLETFSDPSFSSPAQTLLNVMEDNSIFMSAVDVWEIGTFNPSDAVEKVNDQKAYYESIIFSIINSFVYSSSSINATASKVDKLSITLAKQAVKSESLFAQIDYDTFMNTEISELTEPMQEDLMQITKDNLRSMGYIKESVGFICDFIDTSKKVSDYFMTQANLAQFINVTDDVENVLYSMYLNCPSSNAPLKSALREAYDVCHNQKNIYLSNIQNGAVLVTDIVFNEIMSSLWNDCLIYLTSASVANAIFFGQTIGKGLSNFAFSSDKIVEQYYAIKAVCEFEDLAYETMCQLESVYRENRSVSAAKNFMRAIDILFSAKELGVDYSIEYADLVYTDGILTKIMYSKTDELNHYEFIDAVNGINASNKYQHEDLLSLNHYRYHLEVDYPEIYWSLYNSMPLEEPQDEQIFIPTEFETDDNEINNYYLTYKIDENNNAIITGGEGNICARLTIPGYVDGHKVVEIANGAFEGQLFIKRVTISSPIERIGRYAFSNCTSLVEINLPQSLKIIGQNFISNTSIETIVIPKNVTDVDNFDGSYNSYRGGAVDGCTSLKTLIFEDGMKKIPNSFAEYKKSESFIERIVIPSTVTEIGLFAFSNCMSLQSIDIPKSVSEINDYAFYNCSSLKSLTMNFNDKMIYTSDKGKQPYQLTIGSYAFYNCENLSDIIWSENIVSIGSYCFEGCKSLTRLTLPQSILSIYRYAFSDCTSLAEIDLPQNLKIIGQNFISNTAVETLVVPKSVNYVDNFDGSYNSYRGGAVDGCTSLKTLIFEDGMKKIPNSFAEYKKSESFIEKVIIPGSVTEIGYYAFENCNNMTIYGYADSYANTYATTNNIPFVPITCSHSNLVVLNAVTASCFTDGYTGDKYCADCRELVEEGRVITSPYHHTYEEEYVKPTCMGVGYRQYYCVECGDVYIERIFSKLQHTYSTGSEYCIYGCGTKNMNYACSHNWYVSEFVQPTCQKSGKKLYQCSACNESYMEVLSITNHSFVLEITEATPNKQGYTKYNCPVCGYSYVDDITDYASDNSAFMAVYSMNTEYSENDFLPSSYEALNNLYVEYEYLSATSAPQVELDNATTDILTAINELVPYFELSVTAKNGTFESSVNSTSVLQGTEITLKATANEGYKFVGWFVKDTNRYFSYDTTYTFTITSNTNLEAVFVKENGVSLTFKNDSGQIIKEINNTVDEWSEIISIADVLPAVPYKLGHSNGRWVYDEAVILSKLQSGENVTIIPEYDADDFNFPEIPTLTDNAPALTMYYSLDEDNNVGSFAMAVGVPENCEVESVGIAFYYKNASDFDPTKFLLTLNNKMLTSIFDELDEDLYIVNLNKMSSYYNWSVRGYMTYYDTDGNLKTSYSNQINIVDRQQV